MVSRCSMVYPPAFMESHITCFSGSSNREIASKTSMTSNEYYVIVYKYKLLFVLSFISDSKWNDLLSNWILYICILHIKWYLLYFQTRNLCKGQVLANGLIHYFFRATVREAPLHQKRRIFRKIFKHILTPRPQCFGKTKKPLKKENLQYM